MSGEAKRGGDVHATISGAVSGQVAVGNDITQSQQVAAFTGAVTADDMRALKALIADLKAAVEGAAPAEKKAAALERVAELEDAVTADVPDLTTLEYVTSWFAKHLPALAGSVTSLVVHPLVGKVVGAAGDSLVAEFRRRFGGGPTHG
jgi:hypothetical protein